DLYLYVSRWNPSDVTLLVTPVVDGVELEQRSVVLEGVSQPKREVREVAIKQAHESGGSERLRYAPRGTWFTFKLSTSGALPDGGLIFEGVSLEYEVVRESKVAS
ncbi:MAG: hypothetical protein ACOC42_01845, partial [Halobacteriota archaeon]